MQLTWKHIVLLALAALFGFFAGCNRNAGGEAERVLRDTVTVTVPGQIDTVKVRQVSTRTRTRTVHDTVPARVDTAAILQDYLTNERTYTATGQGQDVKVTARPVIFRNRLDTIDFTIKNLRATKIYETKKNALGLSLTGSRQFIAPAITYRHRRWRFGAGYNICQEAPVVSVEYEIFQW